MLLVTDIDFTLDTDGDTEGVHLVDELTTVETEVLILLEVVFEVVVTLFEVLVV